MELMEAIHAYQEKFDEGPGIWGMDEADAIALILEAIENNQPIEESPLEKNLPEGALL